MNKLTQKFVRALAALGLMFTFVVGVYATCSPFYCNSTDNTVVVEILPGGDCDDTEPMSVDHSQGSTQTVDLGCGCTEITGIRINGGSLLTPGYNGTYGSWNVTVTYTYYVITGS